MQTVIKTPWPYNHFPWPILAKFKDFPWTGTPSIKQKVVYINISQTKRLRSHYRRTAVILGFFCIPTYHGPFWQESPACIGEPVVYLIDRQFSRLHQRLLLVVVWIWVVLMVPQPLHHYCLRLDNDQHKLPVVMTDNHPTFIRFANIVACHWHKILRNVCNLCIYCWKVNKNATKARSVGLESSATGVAKTKCKFETWTIRQKFLNQNCRGSGAWSIQDS